ncbi:MAG TPA: ABC transporter permease, partial [Candidatus Berkiella sp.]|nr:ABC transporter permease [Candidatus Berkiella sp.]
VSNQLSGDADYDGKQIPMEGFFVDTRFLDVFSFPLLKGNASTVLEKPHSMVITQAGAERMFGGEDPVGKVIKME